MRLKPHEVSLVVSKLLSAWKESGCMAPRVPEEKLAERLAGIFMAELAKEDDLNAEVEAFLSKYEKEFEKGTLDRRIMFQKVKQQLAKKKGVIL
jgi:hypothetical protein